MLNKPRGLVTSAADERGRSTVYQCLEGAGLPWLAPVGRLDKASEGLLLFSNDSRWAAAITEPSSALLKVYHVQVEGLVSADLLDRMLAGVDSEGERLAARALSVLRAGARTSWLEVTLDEGRNRHIRRLLEAFDLPVLRLLRISIGALALGDLAKGSWRHLTAEEVALLAPSRAR
jgi:23S rRNA pseudouridine2605 synthase